MIWHSLLLAVINAKWYGGSRSINGGKVWGWVWVWVWVNWVQMLLCICSWFINFETALDNDDDLQPKSDSHE